MFLLRFLSFLSPLPKKVQSSHRKKSRKKDKNINTRLFFYGVSARPLNPGTFI